MTESFKGLRFNSVIGRDYKDDNIGDVRSASAHGGKSFVARGVEKGDTMVAPLNGIGTDVLSDSTRLSSGDFGPANGIEQGGFSVIDVSHESDDRWPRLEIG